MTRFLIVLIFALAACEQPFALAAGPGKLHTLQIDLAGCRPRAAADPAPVYDGDLWAFPGAEGIRCSLPIEAGDTITEWLVFGRRDMPGQFATTACLQRLETVLTSAAAQHFTIGHCQSAHPGTQYYDGAFVLTEQLAPAWVTGEDDVYSLFIAGSGTPGHRVGAATIYVLRP